MRICLSLIVAAFIFAFCTAASAAEPGEVASTPFVCEKEQGALVMAAAAMKDEMAWFEAAQETIGSGMCDEYMFNIPVELKRLVLEFNGFNGPGEVWFGLAGPKQVPVNIIIAVPKGPSA